MYMYVCHMGIQKQCYLDIFLQLSINMYHLSVLNIVTYRLFLLKCCMSCLYLHLFLFFVNNDVSFKVFSI